MTTKDYKTLGYTLPFKVPSSELEFNQTAWKAPTGEGNPCLAKAIDQVSYHVTLGEFRDVFLHGREEKKNEAGHVIETAIAGIEQQTEIPRKTKPVLAKDKSVKMKDGEPVTTFDETQEEYFDRVIATLFSEKRHASEDAARAHFEPFAREVASLLEFDASARARAEFGPRKLAAKYKLTAARIIAAGTIAKANTNYLANIGKTFEPTNDTTKMFTGTYEVLDSATKKPTGKTAQVEVSDKDAEALGWLLKEYQDWKAAQEQLAMAE